MTDLSQFDRQNELAEQHRRTLLALKVAYDALLRHPHDVWRIEHQELYCLLRDQIAEATGQSAEDVQNQFEALAQE